MTSIGSTGTSGAGGVNEVHEVAGGDASPVAGGDTASVSRTPTSSRPRSLDMAGLDLQARLDAQLAANTPANPLNAGATGGTPTVPAEAKKDPLNGWKLSASFGPRLESYHPVDVRIKNDRVDVQLEGVEFLQRNSMEYYKFWEAEKAGDVFKFLDEPTNQTTIEGRKGDWIVGIRAYHPKMLVSLGGDGKKNLNTSVNAQGTIEGKPVDGPIDLKNTFGAIHLTHKLMNFEASVGKQTTLAEGKAGKLTLDTSVGMGVYTGMVTVNYRDPKDYWNFIKYDETKMKPIGGEITLKNSLTYMLSGGHVGFGAEVDITRGKMKYDMMGGTTSHKVKSESFAVFVKLEF